MSQGADEAELRQKRFAIFVSLTSTFQLDLDQR